MTKKRFIKLLRGGGVDERTIREMIEVLMRLIKKTKFRFSYKAVYSNILRIGASVTERNKNNDD